MKWTILEDCGNSPKNKMLVDWTVALVEQEVDRIFVTESSTIVFKGVESRLIDFERPFDLDEMHLEKAITHGRDGALLGQAKKGTETYPFALFFTFSLGKQPKIKTLQCIIDRI